MSDQTENRQHRQPRVHCAPRLMSCKDHSLGCVVGCGPHHADQSIGEVIVLAFATFGASTLMTYLLMNSA